MKRKEFISRISVVFGGALLLPKFGLTENQNPQPHFIGIGVGMNNTKSLLQAEYPNAKFTNISSDFLKGEKPSQIFFQTSIDKDLIQADKFDLKVNIPKELITRINKNDQLIIYAGLGGANSSYMLKALVGYCGQERIEHNVFAQYPFRFEGNKRIIRALELSKGLMQKSNFYSYSLEEKRMLWGNMKLDMAFERADQTMFELINLKAL